MNAVTSLGKVKGHWFLDILFFSAVVRSGFSPKSVCKLADAEGAKTVHPKKKINFFVSNFYCFIKFNVWCQIKISWSIFKVWYRISMLWFILNVWCQISSSWPILRFGVKFQFPQNFPSLVSTDLRVSFVMHLQDGPKYRKNGVYIVEIF